MHTMAWVRSRLLLHNWMRLLYNGDGEGMIPSLIPISVYLPLKPLVWKMGRFWHLIWYWNSKMYLSIWKISHLITGITSEFLKIIGDALVWIAFLLKSCKTTKTSYFIVIIFSKIYIVSVSENQYYVEGCYLVLAKICMVSIDHLYCHFWPLGIIKYNIW